MGKLKFILKSKALAYWNESLIKIRGNKKSKLNFFSQAKANFDYAKYLTTCHNVNARNALIKFRLSAHNLPVEVGRYIKMIRGDRLCPFCTNQTGDEKHYLCECQDPHFTNLRTPVFAYLNEKYPNFQLLSPIEKAIFLLNCEDPASSLKIRKFCHNISEIFREFNQRSV